MFEWVSNLFGGSEQKPPAQQPPQPVQAPQQTAPAAAPAPPEATPHADPGAHPAKKLDQKEMDAAANTIFKKIDGWWVSGGDKTAILDTLRGRSPEEIAAIKASYAEHFPGHDMDADLSKNLAGNELKEAKASMSGDQVSAAVAAIKSAETGTFFGNQDNDRITTLLEGIKDPKVRDEVARQIGAEVTSKQSGNDRKLTDALLKGDTAKASAARLDESMHGGMFGSGGFLGTGVGQDKDAMYKAIEDCPPEKRKDMLDAYKQGSGKDLSQDLHANLTGANKDVADSLLAGDPAAANAARVKAATESWFTDKDAIYKAMDGKKPEERKQMIADYQKMYGGSMDSTLKQNLSGLDLAKAQQLENQGKLDDAFALKYAMEGSFWSTDKTLIKKTLQGKSRDEIIALQNKYQKDYGIDLQAELKDTTSGRDGFEINQAMLGEPKTLDEKMARAKDRYQFERGSGSNFISTAMVDSFSDKGQLLDQQQARMEQLYKTIQEGHGTAESKALLDRLTGYQDLDTKNYQESKDSVANGAAAVAAVTAGAIATVATGGAAAPAEVAIISALAGGGATIATKALIQDQGYSNEELRNDVIMTGVNMATGGAMGALGSEGGALFNLTGKLSENPVAQQMMIQGASGAVASGVGGATQTMLAGGSAQDALKAGGMGLVTGGVGGSVTGGVGAGLKGNAAFEGMDPVKAAVLRNSIAGGVGAGAGLAVDPASYKGDSAELLTKWGLAVGGGAVGGAAAGYTEGRIEVETAAALKREEQIAARTGATQPTAGEENVIARAEEYAANPAELEVIKKVEAELAAGGQPSLPVEESPGGAFARLRASPEGRTGELGVASPRDPRDASPQGFKGELAPKVEETAPKLEAAEPTSKKDAQDRTAKPEVVEDAADAVDPYKAQELAHVHAKPAIDDAGDRAALVELSRRANTPEEQAQIAKWAAEIDAKNPEPALQSLRDLNVEARADGHLSQQEGSALKEWGHEGGLDRMPVLDAMHYEGMDRAQVARVFNRAAATDAGASYRPEDAGVHSSAYGVPLAKPGSGELGLTHDEIAMLIDVQARRFDELHPAYTTSAGRELEASPMRKAVSETQAGEYTAGERVDSKGSKVATDTVGGDVGLRSNTEGQHAAQAAATLGLDYDHHTNQYFDPATNTWTPMVTERGLPVVDFDLTPKMHEQLQVPLGSDATEMFKQQGRTLAAGGDYVPELLRSTTGADGSEQFPHLQTRDRQSAIDPRVGWGFSATERAVDPSTGLPLPVTPNQELNMPHAPAPDYEVGKILPHSGKPAGGEHPYRKLGTVGAEQLEAPTTWTTSKGETMQAAAGDWKITGDTGSTWSVKPDIFAQTYSSVEDQPGRFAKTAITHARQLTEATTLESLEGKESGVAGDYVVTGPKGEQYIVPQKKFEAMYAEIEEPPVKSEATAAMASAPGAAKPIAENATLGAKVEQQPELAPVVAAAPELGKEIATPESPVAKVAEQVAAATPKLEETTKPTAAENPIAPQEAFDRAKAAGKGLDPTLSEDIPGFLAAADQARAGADPVLQAKRADFEKAVALSPEAHAAIKTTLDTMCAKALDYITKMRPEDVNGALSSLGKDPTERGYAGAVGFKPEDIRAVLEGGNVRERMVALAEFQDKILGPDVLKRGGLEEMQKVFGSDSAFGKEDIDRLAARRQQYMDEKPAKPSVKGLFGALGGDEGPHAEYARAKAQEMDTKLPMFTAEAAGEQLGAPQSGPTPAGEASPLAKSQLTIAEAQEQGMNLSPRELALAQATGDGERLPWVVGSRANMVDPSAPFIADAKASSMPLKAGISGTTFRAGGLFEALGAKPELAQLACMTQLTSIDAHSYHEIASAAQGFHKEGSEGRYDPSNPYASIPLPRDVLERIAQQQGTTLEELNKQTK